MTVVVLVLPQPVEPGLDRGDDVCIGVVQARGPLRGRREEVQVGGALCWSLHGLRVWRCWCGRRDFLGKDARRRGDRDRERKARDAHGVRNGIAAPSVRQSGRNGLRAARAVWRGRACPRCGSARTCRPMTAAEPGTSRRFLDPHFRWRGHEVTRMEAFADAVFGLVVALLFLWTKVPENLAELKAAMLSLVPFAVTFVLLAMVWVEHHQFFRRYDLRDKSTFFGNLWLLFLVLVYAYPLKFLFTMLFVGWIAPIGNLTSNRMYEGHEQLDIWQLMVFYGVGAGAIYTTFALLYRHALHRADDLE